MKSDKNVDDLHFDEEWYLYRNHDVAHAVRSGDWESGLEHFLTHGQKEGRLGLLPRINPPRLVNHPDNANWNPANPVVVLVRTHKGDEKFRNLVDELNSIRNGFDLYALADRGQGEFPIEDVPVIWHSEIEFGELGLSRARKLHLYGDFSLYFALRTLPAYQYYIMIDDDIAFVEGCQNLLNDICAAIQDSKFSGTDLVGLHFHKQDPTRSWGPPAAKRYTERFCYYCYYPFVMLSKRALSFMLTQRQIETLENKNFDEVIQCEAFTPSCLLAGGFKCMDLLELIPGCYSWQSMALQLDPCGFGVPISYKPEFPPEIRMYHASYTIDEYIRRLEYMFSGEDSDWTRLVRILRSPAAATVPSYKLNNLWKRVPENFLQVQNEDDDIC